MLTTPTHHRPEQYRSRPLDKPMRYQRWSLTCGLSHPEYFTEHHAHACGKDTAVWMTHQDAQWLVDRWNRNMPSDYAYTLLPD